MSPGASKGVSLAGPQRKTKIGNQRKLLHLESKAYCGTELGNSGTTMFDVLRAYWLPISQNSLPHQCATPLRSTSDSGIDTEIFNDFPLQTGFLMCSVPEKRERFEQKENETSFLAKDLPVDKLRRDIKKSWKDKKVVLIHYKVVDWEVKYPKAGIPGVLRISAKSIQKLLNKMCRIACCVDVGSCFQFFFGQTYYWSPRGSWQILGNQILACWCTGCQFALQWDNQFSFYRHMLTIHFE